jgi:hypothetical protein
MEAAQVDSDSTMRCGTAESHSSPPGVSLLQMSCGFAASFKGPGLIPDETRTQAFTRGALRGIGDHAWNYWQYNTPPAL